MRNLILATGLAVLLGVGAPIASAGGNSFQGKLAPEIRPSGWIGGDGRTSLADFRGEVVLLEFWFSH